MGMGLIRKQLWVYGSKGRRKIEALFDTGASHTMIREEIGARLGVRSDLPEPREYEAAVGRFRVRQAVMLDIAIQRRRLFTEVMLAPDLSEDLIIGANFLQDWHIKLEPRRHRIILDPKALRLKAVGSRAVVA